MDVHFPDMILTIVVLSFWILFPVGIFLSMGHIDRNTDQVIRLGHWRDDSTTDGQEEMDVGEPWQDSVYRPKAGTSIDNHAP